MDQQDLIRQFQEITGLDDSQSRFYLESHNFDVEAAAATFFGERPNSPSRTVPSLFPSRPVDQNSTSQPSAQPTISSSSSAPKKTKPASSSGPIRGLSDYRNEEGSSDEDDKVNWYTGGEKSGIQVQAPKKAAAADDVLSSAQQLGAKSIVDQREIDNKPFTGEGFRLGHDPNTKSVASGQKKEVRKQIIFWKNGFSIDDGPLRDYNDPANKAFLDSVKKGLLPKELQQGSSYSEVNVELIDRRGEDYKEPSKVLKPFSGAGQSLGSSSTAAVRTSATTAASTPSGTAPIVDESQPTTSIQIRLHDGSRIVGKFNHTHKVADIRRYIDATKPVGFSYSLMTTFPQKLIADESQSIQETGLMNSVVMQKPK